MSRFKQGDRVLVTDPALAQLRSVMRNATGVDPAPRAGLSEDEREDGRPWTLGEILEAHRVEKLGPLGPVKCHACDEWTHGTIHDHHADLALAFFDVAARLARTADLAAQVARVEVLGVERAARDQRRYESIAATLHTAVIRAERAEAALSTAKAEAWDECFHAWFRTDERSPRNPYRAALSPAQPDTERGGRP